MKRAGKIAVCLAGALALDAGLRADEVVLPGNPYAPIVARNIFGLNPVAPVDPASLTAEPPIKISPNGIMSIFGHLQVLFKAGGTARPGQPAKEMSYILSEGQRQDDIEVVRINEKAGIVTFNNHGQVEELPLAAAPSLSIAAGAGTPDGAQNNNAASPNRFNNANNGNSNGAANRFGGRGANFGGRNRGGENAGATDNGSALRAVPTRGTYQPAQELPRVSPEVQAAQILINTARMKKEGNPAATIMPPVPGMSQPDDE